MCIPSPAPPAPPAIVEILTAEDGASGDELGRSVAVRGPFIAGGRWLADPDGATNAGAARVWRRLADGTTVAEGEVVAPDGAANDEFGVSVALTASCGLDDLGGLGGLGDPADPTTWPRLVVGAWTADLPGKADAGAVYVYRRDPTSGSWTFEAKLTASDAAAASEYGRSVSIDGDLVAIGAWKHQLSRGAVYVHRLVDGAWTQEAKLLASDGTTGDGLGAGVAIDAGRIVAGAWGDDIGPQSNQGSAYVFRRDAPGAWVQEAKLIAAGGASGDEFGRSVAIDGAIDGTTAIVGTWPFFIDGPGAAHVFVRAGSTWTQQATLVHPAPASADYFGFSVGVSGDRALVGAWADDVDGTTNQGSAHLFSRADGAWSHWAELRREKSEPSAYFGFAVGLDEGVAAVGSRLDDVGAHTNQGSVAVVCLDDLACSNCAADPTADLDGDGDVDGADLGLLLGAWGTGGPGDLDGSGVVDGADLGLLLGQWS